MGATVTVSIEIELAWGHHDTVGAGFKALSPDRSAETRTLKALLAFCEDNSIKVTFDVVGHLLHRQCEREHPGPHDPSWFNADPGTDVDTDPQFYAPDLVEAIIDSSVDHEITTHTYSHALCDQHSPEILEWEFQQVRKLHEKWDLPHPRSFVPPRHQRPKSDILREFDIHVLRMPHPDYTIPTGRYGIFKHALTRTHPLGDTRWMEGHLETYCAPRPSLTTSTVPTGRRPPHPAFRAIPISIRRRRHERYLRDAIDRSAATESALHLWTHLYNLSNKHQLACVTAGLDHLASQRDAGKIKIRPMNQLS